jgi:hypothetical protein
LRFIKTEEEINDLEIKSMLEICLNRESQITKNLKMLSNSLKERYETLE